MSQLHIEPPEGLHSFRHEAMATEFVFSLGNVDRDYASQAAHEAFQLIDSIESKLSLYQEISDITRINRAKAGQKITVSEECIACLLLSFKASQLTQNRFHAFVGSEACHAKNKIPSFLISSIVRIETSKLDEPVITIDQANRQIEKLHSHAIVDLGGIGKGFAIDRAAELLQEWDIPISLISSGGSTLLFNAPAGKNVWSGQLANRTLIPFANGALASSGLSFQEAHIVDPKTGESKTLWKRSFVRVKTAAMADALSTGALLTPWPQIVEMQKNDTALSFAVESEDNELSACGNFFG